MTTSMKTNARLDDGQPPEFVANDEPQYRDPNLRQDQKHYAEPEGLEQAKPKDMQFLTSWHAALQYLAHATMVNALLAANHHARQ